jgi:hypothetical protein
MNKSFARNRYIIQSAGERANYWSIESGWVGLPSADFAPLLVTEGHHASEPLFNK